MQYNTSLPILEAVSRGEITRMPELIRNLAQQDLFVPVVEIVSSDDSLSCKALVLASEEGNVLPAFTSKERLMLWTRLRGHAATEQRINSAVLAAELDGRAELLVDPDSSHAIQLSAVWLERLADQVPFAEPSSRSVNTLKAKVERELVHSIPSVVPAPDAPGSTGILSSLSRLY
jgi:hypothetical protein